MTEDQSKFEPQESDIVVTDKRHGAQAPVVQAESDPFLIMVERLSANPNVDVDKLERILKMNEQILDRNEKRSFNDSFTKAQSKIDLIVATSENLQTKSNYAKLSNILVRAKGHW